MPRAAQSKKYIINVYVLQKWYTQDKKNKKEKRKKKVGQTIPEDPMASPNYDKVWMTFFFFFTLSIPKHLDISLVGWQKVQIKSSDRGTQDP